MLPQILAFTIDAGGPDGAHLDFGNMPFILGALPFVVVIILIITLSWYFLNKKRLEHQQILAAIEKGTPLSELRPVKKEGPHWIKSLSTGIAFLLMGLGFVSIATYSILTKKPDEDTEFGLFIVSVVFWAIGAAGVISGILRKKTEKELSSEKLTLDANERQ